MQSPLLLCKFEYVSIPNNISSMVPTHNPEEILIQTDECEFYMYNTTTNTMTNLHLPISKYDSASKLFHADANTIMLVTNYGFFITFKFDKSKSTWLSDKKQDVSVQCEPNFIAIVNNHIFGLSHKFSHTTGTELRCFNKNTLKLRDKFNTSTKSALICDAFVDSESVIIATTDEISEWSSVSMQHVATFNFNGNGLHKFSKFIFNYKYIVCLRTYDERRKGLYYRTVLNVLVLSRQNYSIVAQFDITGYKSVVIHGAHFITDNHICVFDTHFLNNLVLYVDIIKGTTLACLKYSKPTITAYVSTYQYINTDSKFIFNSCDRLIIQRYTSIKTLFVFMLCLYRFKIRLPTEIIHNIMLFLGINTYR